MFRAYEVSRCLSIALVLALFSSAAAAELDRDGNPIDPLNQPGGRDPATPTATAGVTTYDNQGSFLAASGLVTTEDFEDDAADTGCSGGTATMLFFDGFLATSSSPALRVNSVECFGNHNTTPGGANYLSVDTDLGDVSADVLLVFNTQLSAFGLFLMDLDLSTIELTINGNIYVVPSNGDGGQSYFGIISTSPFTSIALSDPSSIDSHWSLDDVAHRAQGPVSVRVDSWGRVKARYR